MGDAETGTRPRRKAGLRERKRRQVQNAIELAAVQLALELGHTEVTVAEICERAEVSRSTFFNYMPTREAAIFGKTITMVDQPTAFAILDANDSGLPHGLLLVIGASLEHLQANAKVAAGRRRLVHEQPGAASVQNMVFSQLREDLTGLAIAWLQANPDRRALPDTSLEKEAVLSVGLAAMVGTTLIERVSELEGDVTLLGDEVAETFADLRHIAAT